MHSGKVELETLFTFADACALIFDENMIKPFRNKLNDKHLVYSDIGIKII